MSNRERAVRNGPSLDNYRENDLPCWKSLTHVTLKVENIRCVASYLCLSEAELSRQLRSLGQSEILRLLEASLKSSELVAGINRPRFADLFRFSIHHADLGLWLFFH